jgi:hypothetical protein
MMMVADVKRPDMTAREETRTVMGDPVEGTVGVPFGGDGAGVGYALIAALLLVMLIETKELGKS